MSFVPRENPNLFGGKIVRPGDWEKLSKLGEGGQGIVWYVRRARQVDTLTDQLYSEFCEAIATLPEKDSLVSKAEQMNKIRDFVRSLVNEEEVTGALKELHAPEQARDADRARERMKREIDVMADVSHPNLLKILAHSTDQNLWYVSEFHRGGALEENLNQYQGDPITALTRVRNLIEAVSILHKNGQVHRDIKPANIFLGKDDELILGDFGLVYLESDRTRYSGTFENVGSRDWMPGWAYSKRVEEVLPTFDVFALGKVIWAMISGKPVLPLWYFDRDGNNLEKIFPTQPEMAIVNELLSKCVVEDEKSCLGDASRLLESVDATLEKLRLGVEKLSKAIKCKCRVCGTGHYQLAIDRNTIDLRNFGISPAGTASFRVLECSACGHVQLFSCQHEGYGDLPEAWVD